MGQYVQSGASDGPAAGSGTDRFGVRAAGVVAMCAGAVALAAAPARAQGTPVAEPLAAAAPDPVARGDLIRQNLQSTRGLGAADRATVRRALILVALGQAPARPGTGPAAVAAAPPAASAPPAAGYPLAVADLLNLIAKAEAGPAGYDAIQHRAWILPGKPPSQLTLAEIRSWIAATPGQQHAIGRYQIIPATLDYLIRDLRLPENAVFSPTLQDAMAVHLLEDAGLHAFLAGAVSPDMFMDNIARVWAGLPLNSGQSAYHGFNGNRATMTRAAFEERFLAIFPRAVEESR